jgi:hypothetical protein
MTWEELEEKYYSAGAPCILIQNNDQIGLVCWYNGGIKVMCQADDDMRKSLPPAFDRTQIMDAIITTLTEKKQ